MSVQTLADVLDRASTLPAAQAFVSDEDDPLTLLIYTSGSTGAPKGAMQPERLVANLWRKSEALGQPHSAEPWITLSFMPMSHLMGRACLYGTLGKGGTAYFAAKSDLSTFLDDLALARPTRCPARSAAPALATAAVALLSTTRKADPRVHRAGRPFSFRGAGRENRPGQRHPPRLGADHRQIHHQPAAARTAMRPTAIASDEDLIADLVNEPTVTNVSTSHYPTYHQMPEIPHHGYPADFLMRTL